ncbi:MAG: DivIVA domain-containing protein [Clostridiales bacterium]|nr:DivIVA domain-containing protein [Clostridiales bacterium]
MEDVKRSEPRVGVAPAQLRSGTEESVSSEESAFANDIEFDVAFRGYNRKQVDNYIEQLTAEYNDICVKCAALEDENSGLRLALSELMRTELTRRERWNHEQRQNR